ncbi:MAG: hypothetical protein RLZZ142_1354, partial [Verrucomicrobiota bacterium]
ETARTNPGIQAKNRPRPTPSPSSPPSPVSMKKLTLLGYAALLGLLAYQWVDADSTQLRLQQSSQALQSAQRETQEARAQLAANKQHLDAAQSALQETQAQLVQARTATPSAPPPGASTPQTTQGASGNASFTDNLIRLADKASKLDQAFKNFPALEIPELALLNEADWIKAVSDHPQLETPDQIRRALESLANSAKSRAMDAFRDAVSRTGPGSESKPLENLDPLLAELRKKMNEEILQRYEILPSARLEPGWREEPEVKSHLAEVKQAPSLVVREKTPAGGQQQVIIFFALPENRETGKSYHSSTSFFLSQKSTP